MSGNSKTQACHGCKDYLRLSLNREARPGEGSNLKEKSNKKKTQQTQPVIMETKMETTIVCWGYIYIYIAVVSIFFSIIPDITVSTMPTRTREAAFGISSFHFLFHYPYITPI